MVEMLSLLAERTLPYKEARSPLFFFAISELPRHPSVPAPTSPGVSVSVSVSLTSGSPLWAGTASHPSSPDTCLRHINT